MSSESLTRSIDISEGFGLKGEGGENSKKIENFGPMELQISAPKKPKFLKKSVLGQKVDIFGQKRPNLTKIGAT